MCILIHRAHCYPVAVCHSQCSSQISGSIHKHKHASTHTRKCRIPLTWMHLCLHCWNYVNKIWQRDADPLTSALVLTICEDLQPLHLKFPKFILTDRTNDIPLVRSVILVCVFMTCCHIQNEIGQEEGTECSSWVQVKASSEELGKAIDSSWEKSQLYFALWPKIESTPAELGQIICAPDWKWIKRSTLSGRDDLGCQDWLCVCFVLGFFVRVCGFPPVNHRQLLKKQYRDIKQSVHRGRFCSKK